MTDPRALLSPGEAHTLESQILPTARRWLRLNERLARHGAQTLSHWGEPLIDDRGRAYVSEGDKRAAKLAQERRPR